MGFNNSTWLVEPTIRYSSKSKYGEDESYGPDVPTPTDHSTLARCLHGAIWKSRLTQSQIGYVRHDVEYTMSLTIITLNQLK